MASFFSIKKDLHIAGANWADEAVVEDGNLITSRYPGDLEAFINRLISHHFQKTQEMPVFSK